MQKKKFNVLDLAICLAVICSVCLIFFRDTVAQIFEEPVTVALEVTVDVNGSETVARLVGSETKTVVYYPDVRSDKSIEMTIIDIVAVEKPNAAPERARLTLSINGYKRLGKYYTESGERIYENSDCTFSFGGMRVEGHAVSVEKSGT